PHRINRAKGPSPNDLFDGLVQANNRAVATDSPSEMRVANPRPPGFKTNWLADYPPDARPVRGGALIDPTVAVSMQLGGNRFGRLVVFADNNVFANGMMGFRKDEAAEKRFSFDNGNWELANRTIDWMKQTWGDGERTQCLFVENGTIITQFAIPVPQK